MYATEEELISELEDVELEEGRADTAIKLASDYIDLMTGQWFEDRVDDMLVDGKGQCILFLPVFARAISSISVDGSVLDSSYYTVYNRFLPDDRRNPKIVFAHPLAKGNLNVKISGTFGYVDKHVEGEETTYITPPQIKKICIMLALNDIELLSSASRRDIADRGRIIEEETDRHRYKLSEVFSTGAYTGVPEIDQVLMAYRKPIGIDTI